MASRTLHAFTALSLTLVLGACDSEPAPDDGSQTGYWDEAEVESACGSWANTLATCDSGGPSASELSDSCSESMLVDNPSESASCHQTMLDHYDCVGALTCEALDAYAEGADDSPCKAEFEAIADAC